ncbi:GDSL esterase/lipase LIP-4-like isoform X1 [Salvia miltiorrhiza]|uniref:GDSL esterase/lipase LIP-4-like isoform X1 n=1 Tax=Salvia miltiorrhiza TaxID=226208 RepID=UPI0025ACBD2A|nr:GDSL esterase/lipase LIP-4-like isoform X1 [Salvia miltiorrhiza]
MGCYYNYKRCVFSLMLRLCLIPLVASEEAVIFNFGDSNSDTGGFAAANGFNFGYPYGRAFFHQPTGRLSDGRLILDFLCENVHTSYLKAYLNPLEPDVSVSKGVNFAVSGSSILPPNALFNLGVQINQFSLFHNRSLHLRSKGRKDVLDKKDFKNAIYIFDIGQNDLTIALTFNPLPYDQVVENIPSFISGIKDAMWAIYKLGGRNFWVHNTGPLGCLPQQLGIRRPNITQVDELGCISILNEAARLFNSNLNHLCQQLRIQMKHSTIVYVDVYSIKHSLVANSSSYGLKKALMACCGHGGPPYNYDPKIRCLVVSGYSVCEKGDPHISWDGIHYTEAANKIVASLILSKKYSTPPLGFDFFLQ